MDPKGYERPSAPVVIIVMGVSGSGKFTVASMLALRGFRTAPLAISS
jgi:adenylylsulfate kinase-like enzyme